MNKKMIFIMVGVLVLGIGGTAVFFMLRPTPAGQQAEAPPPPKPGIVDMETFLVNVNDPAGDRFAKLTLRLAIAPTGAAEAVGADELIQARMRDRVLTLVTAKSLPELLGPTGKETLRREIKAQLTPLLEDGEIQDVLFSEFVVQ